MMFVLDAVDVLLQYLDLVLELSDVVFGDRPRDFLSGPHLDIEVILMKAHRCSIFFKLSRPSSQTFSTFGLKT